MPLDGIKHIVLVLSGKGGVGKSSITTQLALTLSLQGHSVGVLDIDLTGPSIPRFFGVENAKVTQAPGGLVPVTIHDGRSTSTSAVASQQEPNGTDKKATYGPLSCMSLGFILSSRNTAVIWRGPKKTAMVRQFLTSTLWPDNLDYLLIDTPPGTSDEHISVFETLQQTVLPGQLSGAVVVTTPQAISISDVRKELNFCKKVDCKVLGVVENMAGFVCPNCSECTNIFSKGGGEVMAKEFGVKFLGSVPIDPAFVELVEEGKRPSYPQGTVVAGVDHSEREYCVNGDDPTSDGIVPGTEQQNHESDAGSLVEKYTSCSLYPIFDKIVQQVVDGITHDIAG